MTAIASIRQRLGEVPEGEPFTTAAFLAFGTRAAVDQALSRLTKSGEVLRLARGIFVRPRRSQYVGTVLPEPMKVAEALARAENAQVQVHGAEAARLLELTTQMSVQPVFETSGPSKRFRLGNLEVVLRHKSPRRFVLAGRPAGLAISALSYLGKDAVTSETLRTIRGKLGLSEFEALLEAAPHLPGWLADALFRFRRQEASA
jgi:hypothetical protein